MRSGRKPGSTALMRRRLSTSRPAPIRRTSERATSETTRPSRRRRRPLPAERPPSFSTELRSVRSACRAGTRPIVTPVSNERTRPKASTDPSRGRFPSSRGRPPGARATRPLTPQSPRVTPRAPPTEARTIPSARSSRTIRPRPAPRALRSAISFLRSVARASRRLATFAQAMRSTRATAPWSATRLGRTSSTTMSPSGTTPTPRPAFVLGNSFSMRLAITARSDSAWDGLTPGRSRPIANRLRSSRVSPSRFG